MSLGRVIVNGKLIPSFRISKKYGWKCELTQDTNRICLVCAPRDEVDA